MPPLAALRILRQYSWLFSVVGNSGINARRRGVGKGVSRFDGVTGTTQTAERLLALGLDAQFAGKLLHLFGVLQQLFQFALEAVGAIHGAEQFPQAVASVEELS